VGPDPTDAELQQLAGTGRAQAVVNVGPPSVAEQAAAAALHLAYLRIPVTPGGALTGRQLRVLVSFMRFHTTRGDSVYLHDCDCGSGQAATTSAMLLITHGASWRGITTAGLGSMDRAQWRAVRQLDAARHSGHGALPGNPYSAARGATW
jgi:acetyl-CoA acetyltransferase